MSARRPVLLLIDDEESVLSVVGHRAGMAGFEVVECVDHEAALRLTAGHHADVAMAGLRVPGADGTDLLRAIRRLDASCQVVVMSHDGSTDAAIAAIRLGALDYLVKPLDERRLDELFAGIRDEAWRRQHLLASEGDVAQRLELLGLVGRGPAMQGLFSLIRRLAPHVRVALVTGETGTGKELVARALHALGPWRSGGLTVVSCAGLSASRAELMARSGGEGGLFEAARQGALLLDDVSELPRGAQEALLRFLEGGEALAGAPMDGRGRGLQIIAVSRRDLRASVASGGFRRDLHERLGQVVLHVRPLRDRREDIPYLAAHFVREFSHEFQRSVRGLTVGAERSLVSAPWPGNVRELRNVLEQACLLSEGDLITEREVADAGVEPVEEPGRGRVPAAFPRQAERVRPPLAPQAAIEREYVLRALQQAGGNKKVAANMLGLSRRAFYRRLERHDLDDAIHRRTGRPAASLGTAMA